MLSSLATAGAWVSRGAWQESSGASEEKPQTLYHKSKLGATILILSVIWLVHLIIFGKGRFTGQLNNSSRAACITFALPSPVWKLSVSQHTPSMQSKHWEPKSLRKMSCLESQTRTVVRFHTIIQAGIFLPWLVSQMFRIDKPWWSCAKTMCLDPFSLRHARSSDQTRDNLKDFCKLCQNTFIKHPPCSRHCRNWWYTPSLALWAACLVNILKPILESEKLRL